MFFYNPVTTRLWSEQRKIIGPVKDSPSLLKAQQQPCNQSALGRKKNCGNKVRLHPHPGKGFSGDYAINKCHQYVFGQRFVWVTDCYAIKFILSYEGSKPAILRLQMRLM